jgi:uncharacterized membrane protein
MPFCASCGSQVEGKFCAKCGATVGAASPPAGAAPPGPAPGAYAGAPGAPATGMTDNVASALSYVLIAGILFLVIAPYNQNKTIRFHAFQSIFMHVAMFAVWIGLRLMFLIVGSIFGFWLIALLFPLLALAFFIIWLFMVISAYQGKTVELPLIGPMARQQA